MADTQNTQQTPPQDPDMVRLNALANLLDNQFRIPGTSFRFGLDSIIGLVPYVGDMAGLIVSGFLFRIMLKRGAGPILMLRMLFNVILDALVGTVPFIGDLFDFGYKANRRNVDLLQKYYADGNKKPNAKYSVGFLMLIFFAVFIGIIWLVAKAVGWIWTAASGAF
jgi:hypothetical protein